VLTLFLGVYNLIPQLDDPKSKEAIKVLLKEFRDYGQTNIIPKMHEWKTTLDNSISTEDLNALNELRNKAKELRKESVYYTFAILRAKKNNLSDSLKIYQDARKTVVQDQKKMLEDLKPLAEKYKSTLEEIGQDAKPLIKNWTDDIKAIAKNWFEKNKNVLSPDIKSQIIKKVIKLKLFEGLDVEKKTKLFELKKKLIIARFMLWDGSDITDFNQMIDNQQKDPSQNNQLTPEGFSLLQNYPNPFNPTTTITFSIPKDDFVSLKVYDILGKEIETLIENNLSAGIHKIDFNANNLSSGIYIYRLKTGNTIIEKRMHLLK
jgi:hypothetical protein